LAPDSSALIASPRAPARKLRSSRAVGIHMAGHRLDGAASPELPADRRSHTAALAGDENAPVTQAVPRDSHDRRRRVRSRCRSSAGPERARAPACGRHRDCQAAPACRGHQTLNLRRVQRIELGMIGLLCASRRATGAIGWTKYGARSGRFGELAADVADDAAEKGLQAPDLAARPSHLRAYGHRFARRRARLPRR
jgi:hypothetical protein